MNKGNKTTDSSFLDVCKAIIEKSKRDINVAEIAIVKQSLADGTYLCEFVNNSNTNIACVKLKDLTLAINDVVVILFCDTDFRTNLKRITSGQIPQLIDSELLHTKNYGVIIGII